MRVYVYTPSDYKRTKLISFDLVFNLSGKNSLEFN